LPFASRFIALLLMASQWPKRLLAGSKNPFSAVAQTVGFDLGKSKVLYWRQLVIDPRPDDLVVEAYTGLNRNRAEVSHRAQVTESLRDILRLP
jgi:hypothetical protein